MRIVNIITENGFSSGPRSLPTFLDNNNGTATIGSTQAYLYSSSDFSGLIKKYTIAGNTFTFTDGEEEYIVADYNSGTPILRKETNKALINGSSVCIIYTCWRQGTKVHYLDSDATGLGLSNKILNLFYNTEIYKRSLTGGLIISESITPNPRTILVTGATVFSLLNANTITPFNSSLDEMTQVNHSSGNWVYSNVLVYNNTQYDDGTNLSTIPTDKYAVRWFYMSIGDTHKTVYYLLGNNFYDRDTDARLEPAPNYNNLPKPLRHTILIGRAIIKYDDANGIVESAFDSALSSGIIEHNLLAEIQGGDVDTYYHSNQPINDTDVPLFAGMGLGSDTPWYDGMLTLEKTSIIYGKGPYNPETGIFSLLNLNPAEDQTNDETYSVMPYLNIPAESTHIIKRANAIYSEADNYGAGNVDELTAIESGAYNEATGIVAYLRGGYFWADMEGGEVTELIGIEAWSGGYSPATITNEYGILINIINYDSTPENRYGIYLKTPIGTATNDWGIYQEGTQKNHFSGDLEANILESTVAEGTPPLTVASSTMVDNLNVEMVGGMNAEDIKIYAIAMAIALG